VLDVFMGDASVFFDKSRAEDLVVQYKLGVINDL
jgi:hypothetical protein